MKKIFLILSILCTALTLSAKPIDEKQARDIATNFFSQHMTRSAACNLKLEWAGSNIMGVSRAANTTDNPLLYIYNNESANGFVIVSGDTNTDLVVAYSLNNNFDADNMSEAAQALLDAWCRQIEDARNSGKHISSESYQLTRANDELLYDTALWDQSEPYNREAPVIDGERSLTGCAATAMSIICYYHKWPNKGVGTTPAYTYVWSDDNEENKTYTYSVAANPLGRPYEYSKMKKSYDSSSKDYTEAQANAVAALMKDMGTAIKMSYHPKGSGASKTDVVYAFSNYFSYSKGIQLAYANDYSYEEWTALLRENLRNCGGPVYFTGADYSNGGHAYVLDGYDANNRFHINYGWSGFDNGYYYLPASEFYKDQSTTLNLKPDKDGTSVQQYYDHLTLAYLESKDGEIIATGILSDASSYSTGSEFLFRVGAIYNNGITTFNGYIALALCDKNGNIKEVLSYTTRSLDPGALDVWDDRCVITETINEGDRLRVFYMGEYSSDWQWARKLYADEYTVDEVIVKASPEDMAKDLWIKYEKDSHRITFSNKQAMKVDIYYHDTNKKYGSDEVGSFAKRYLDLTPGEAYRFEFSLGAEPYKVVIRP